MLYAFYCCETDQEKIGVEWARQLDTPKIEDRTGWGIGGKVIDT